MHGGIQRRANSWAEVEALPPATRAVFSAAFCVWVAAFAVRLANYWPMSEQGQLRVRSLGSDDHHPWPKCWFEHGAVRDHLLTAYVWDQKLTAITHGPIGAKRAAYQKHVRREVVPAVQQIAHRCSLRHVPG